jgi:proteasome lid subunit RPN8/RPN11
MYTPIKTKIIEEAEKNPNIEICGFIYTTLHKAILFPCSNMSLNPESEFVISSEDFLTCSNLGKIRGIYHSHPKGTANFSDADIEMSEEICLPIYVYSLIEKKMNEYIPKSYSLPYEGRSYVWGFDDCYEMVRIYYRQELGINISDYDRDESYSYNEDNLIEDNFWKEGFVKSPDMNFLKKHDIILCRGSIDRVKHFGIFLGNSRVLHHGLGKLSTVSFLDGSWSASRKMNVRHKSLI